MEISVQIGKGGSLGAYKAMEFIGKNHVEEMDQMTFKRHRYLVNDYKLEFVSNPWSNPKPSRLI